MSPGKWFTRPGAVRLLWGFSTLAALFSIGFASRCAGQPTTPKVVDGTVDGAARVWNVALSPDGTRLVAGAEGIDGRPAQLILWELGSKREVFRIEEPRASRGVAFSPDGRAVVTGGFGPVARIFDARNGRLLRPLKGHTEGINAVAFSPDGKTVATGSWDRSVKLWDVATGQAKATLSGHTAQVYGLAFSPDGKTIASCGVDTTARLWDTASGQAKAVLKGHRGVVESLTYSPDGKTIVTAGWDRTLRLWDAADGREQARFDAPVDQLAVAYSPDGSSLVSLSAPGAPVTGLLTSVLIFWDQKGGKPLATIPAHSDRSYAVLFTPDGKTLVTSSMDRTIKVWDVASRTLKDTLTTTPAAAKSAAVKPPRPRDTVPAPTLAPAASLGDFGGALGAIAYSPDGKTLAVGGQAPELFLVDTKTRTRRKLPANHHQTKAVAFSPDGRFVASCGWDRTAKVWEVATGRPVATVSGHKDGVTSVAFSPDGSRLATGCWDGTTRVWDVGTRTEVLNLPAQPLPVNRVRFSPDGQTLATATGNWKTSDPGLVTLWDANSGAARGALRGHAREVSGLAFSPEGAVIATGSADRTVRLWDAKDRSLVVEWDGLRDTKNVAFSPDSLTLAAGFDDGTITLWDVVAGNTVARLKGHQGFAFAVAFAPDGRTLASAGADGTVKLWSLPARD